MRVLDIFYNCNSYEPRISIYNNEQILVFEKEPNKTVYKCEYLSSEVDWIDEISPKEIRIRVR